MAYFPDVSAIIRDAVDFAGDAVGDVVESVGDYVLGSRGQRGERAGEAVGRYLYGDVGAAVGREVGQVVSDNLPRSSGPSQQRGIQEDDVSGPVTQQDYDNIQALRDQADQAMQNPVINEGTVIDIRYPRTAGFPATIATEVATTAAVGAGMDFIDQITDYFAGGDETMTQNMMMCRPEARRPYTINRQTGCISITRKQQTKLKELVRNVGIEVASKQIGLPVSMVTQLLLRTFRTRRRGISGADMRAVKRVDRQMHSLACALGGISTTSRAVTARKSPPKRSC